MFLLELLEKQRFGAPCSFDSTDNFTMAFVGAGLYDYYFSSPKDSQFAHTEGACTGHYKPDKSCLEVVELAFQKVPRKLFHKNFQGYIAYEE